MFSAAPGSCDLHALPLEEREQHVEEAAEQQREEADQDVGDRLEK